jgi:geranylgeranyl diphosphate synthase type II
MMMGSISLRDPVVRRVIIAMIAIGVLVVVAVSAVVWTKLRETRVARARLRAQLSSLRTALGNGSMTSGVVANANAIALAAAAVSAEAAALPPITGTTPLLADELLALGGAAAADYEAARVAVDRAVARAAPGNSSQAPRLRAACAKAVSGGKRLRGVIALEVGRRALELRVVAGGSAVTNAEAARVGAASVFAECAHAASLVIDDGPAFDDDAERRGDASVPAEFGTAMSQLAALALLMEAVESAARAGGAPAAIEAARALGAAGAASGQALDAVALPAELQAGGGVAAAVKLKTAPFFAAAAAVGWLAAESTNPQLAGELRAAGTAIGFALQVCDDIGDVEQDAARAAAGKPGRNYVAEFGMGAACDAARRALTEGRERLTRLNMWSPRWVTIYDKILTMTGIPPL